MGFSGHLDDRIAWVVLLIGGGVLLLRASYYVILVAAGRAPAGIVERRLRSAAGRSFDRAFGWVMHPLVTLLCRAAVSPDALTAGSLLISVMAAVFIARGHLMAGGTTALAAASLDWLDGRVARQRGVTTRAGGFLDSTLDRYADLALWWGAALLFHDNPLLLSVCLLGIGAGFGVPYARARAEVAGITLSVGLMQRPARIILFCLGALADPLSGLPGHRFFAGALVVIAILTTVTAVHRTVVGYQLIRKADKGQEERVPLVVRFCEWLWSLHSMPQPARARGNIGLPRWRPRLGAVLFTLPFLIAVSLLAGVPAQWLAHLPLQPAAARYIVWMLTLTAAFVYVAKATTAREGNPLRGRHGGYRDYLLVQLAGAALWFLVSPAELFAPNGDWRAHLLQFVVPFLCGVHFSYLEKLPTAFVHSSSEETWRSGGIGERAWMVVRLTALAAAVVSLVIRSAEPWPLLSLLAVALVFLLIGRRVRPYGYRCYVHHWFAFLCLAFLSGHAMPVFAAATGAFVEAAARWSCAPLWHRETQQTAAMAA